MKLLNYLQRFYPLACRMYWPSLAAMCAFIIWAAWWIMKGDR